MKKIVLIMVMIVSFLSCEIETTEAVIDYDKTFINNSSYDILITPNGQDWTEFVLGSGTERTITIDQEKIWFYYECRYNLNVYVDNGAVVFEDI